jgi:aspartate/methionine/tyrosine aminotransferase
VNGTVPLRAMQIADFELERYFAQHEFTTRYLLCASDVEGYAMRDLLSLADAETLELWDRLTLGYTESAGLPALRAEVASLYDSVGPDDVLMFAGAEEGVFIAMHALLAPGDHAVVAWPAYQSLHEVARSLGASVTLVPLDPRQGWSLDPDAMRRAIRPNTRVVVINYPHSPTGALLDRDAFDAIVDVCTARGVTLFSDEVYRFLEHDPAARLPAAVDATEVALSLGVMSKAFGLAGLRIGWIATRDGAVRRRLAALKDYTTICNSAPSELLALIALRARDHVLARASRIISGNLTLLDEFFARHRTRLEWVRPAAGSVAFPRLITGDADRFAAALVEREGVLLLPGSRFGYPGSHFRIGLGRVDMRPALERLDSFLQREAVS